MVCLCVRVQGVIPPPITEEQLADWLNDTVGGWVGGGGGG